MKAILQVISVSPKDCQIIQQCQANRIQLVSALQIGGLTPSNTIIRKSLQCCDLPIMVMIRHHNNGFVYDKQQKQLMIQQILHCQEMKVGGIVIGGLKQSKEIDEQLLERMKQEKITNKIEITFHKACDYSTNIIQTYQKLTNYGINRMLTQGGNQPILSNIKTLQQLIKQQNNPKNPKILIGGGITHQNVKNIVQSIQPSQIHIGTCVREDKYGPVNHYKLTQFIKILKE